MIPDLASDPDLVAVGCHPYDAVAALQILDRVGGGASFAAGLIYALLEGLDPQTAVDYGAAHGALAVTTPGDTSMASLSEVDALARGAGARIER